MNKRIKELAEQARIQFPKTDYSGEFWVFDEEKFVELIIKETMQVVSNNLPPNTYLDVADAVVEHFKE